MSVRFWRWAGHFGGVIKHCLCISREICTVPSLYRPSTDGLIHVCVLVYVDSYMRVLKLW